MIEAFGKDDHQIIGAIQTLLTTSQKKSLCCYHCSTYQPCLIRLTTTFYFNGSPLFGVTDTALRWFQSHLGDCTQSVHRSSCSQVNCTWAYEVRSSSNFSLRADPVRSLHCRHWQPCINFWTELSLLCQQQPTVQFLHLRQQSGLERQDDAMHTHCTTTPAELIDCTHSGYYLFSASLQPISPNLHQLEELPSC